MQLENVVLDCRDHAATGQFWADLLGVRCVYNGDGEFDVRLADFPDGTVLDLCCVPVGDPLDDQPRLHLDLCGGTDRAGLVARALGLGATHLDIGQGDVPWTVLADPEGHPFCIMDDRPSFRPGSPVGALPIDCVDAEASARFWQRATGWVREDRDGPALRHPSGRGPLLEFCPEPHAKTRKNGLHLDLRLEAGEDAAGAIESLLAAGAQGVDHAWGDLPWIVLRDPSGNEFCVLSARG